jgi:predicted nucleic acid-binding protein
MNCDVRRALPEIICNTSPLQYLHQLRLLETVAALVGELIVPPAVVAEISAGRKRGVDLPDLNRLDWVKVRVPLSSTVTSLVTDLGPGETQVLMLALESADAIVVLDDGMARQFAETLKLRLPGTLGLLIDAKHAGMLSTVTPQLNRLQALGFRLAPATRTAVLRLAGE